MSAAKKIGWGVAALGVTMGFHQLTKTAFKYDHLAAVSQTQTYRQAVAEYRQSGLPGVWPTLEKLGGAEPCIAQASGEGKSFVEANAVGTRTPVDSTKLLACLESKTKLPETPQALKPFVNESTGDRNLWAVCTAVGLLFGFSGYKFDWGVSKPKRPSTQSDTSPGASIIG